MKALTTEKAVRMIEAQNVLVFEISKLKTKDDVKAEVEKIFEVKVDGVRTLIKNGKKYAYVKLNKKFLAMDLATKLGLL